MAKRLTTFSKILLNRIMVDNFKEVELVFVASVSYDTTEDNGRFDQQSIRKKTFTYSDCRTYEDAYTKASQWSDEKEIGKRLIHVRGPFLSLEKAFALMEESFFEGAGNTPHYLVTENVK